MTARAGRRQERDWWHTSKRWWRYTMWRGALAVFFNVTLTKLIIRIACVINMTHIPSSVWMSTQRDDEEERESATLLNREQRSLLSRALSCSSEVRLLPSSGVAAMWHSSLNLQCYPPGKKVIELIFVTSKVWKYMGTILIVKLMVKYHFKIIFKKNLVNNKNKSHVDLKHRSDNLLLSTIAEVTEVFKYPANNSSVLHKQPQSPIQFW